MIRQFPMSATMTSPFARGYASSGVCNRPGPDPAWSYRPYSQTILRVAMSMRTMTSCPSSLAVIVFPSGDRKASSAENRCPAGRLCAVGNRQWTVPRAIDHQDPSVLTIGDHQVAGEWPGRDGHGRSGRRARLLERIRSRRVGSDRRGRRSRRSVSSPRAYRRRTSGMVGSRPELSEAVVGGWPPIAPVRNADPKCDHDEERAEHDRAERPTGRPGPEEARRAIGRRLGHVRLLRRSRTNVQVLTGIRARSRCREGAGPPRRAGSHDSR